MNLKRKNKLKLKNHLIKGKIMDTITKTIFFGMLWLLFANGSIDNQAPDFELQTLTGKVITSHELKGKIILLDFWDTRCGPCIQLMPHEVEGVE